MFNKNEKQLNYIYINILIYIEPEYGFICAFKKIKYKFKNLYLFNYGNK